MTRQTAVFNRPTTTDEAPKARSFSPALTRSSPARLKVECQRWSRDTPHVDKNADSADCKVLTQHSTRNEKLCYRCTVCPRSALKEADPDSQVTKNRISTNHICANTVESLQSQRDRPESKTGHEATYTGTMSSTNPMKKLVYETSCINIIIVPR